MVEYLIDPGHGGSDPGAVAFGNIEKDYTIEAAHYISSKLKENGIGARLTRDRDQTLPPSTRTSVVKSIGAEKGMSLHFNAGGGTGAEFIKSIHSNGAFEILLKEEFEKAGFPVRKIIDKKGKSGKDYYFMHRDTGKTRITIVEFEFLDGKNAEKIKDYEYRRRMYDCVVNAVLREEGKTKVEAPKPVTPPPSAPVSVPKPAPVKAPEASIPFPGTLFKVTKPMMRGKDVERIQRASGMPESKVDGIYGKDTESYVKKYQARKGLKDDGIVGKNTWNMMF